MTGLLRFLKVRNSYICKYPVVLLVVSIHVTHYPIYFLLSMKNINPIFVKRFMEKGLTNDTYIKVNTMKKVPEIYMTANKTYSNFLTNLSNIFFTRNRKCRLV